MAQGRITDRVGDPDEALTRIELALVRADRLTATERALLHTTRAHALAKLGLAPEAMAAVGVADKEFSDARPRPPGTSATLGARCGISPSVTSSRTRPATA